MFQDKWILSAKGRTNLIAQVWLSTLRKTHRKLVNLLVASSLIAGLAACGGDTPNTGGLGNNEAADAAAVTTTLRPFPNGFSFPNFPASATLEEFNEADLVEMFGAGACVDGVVDPCVPIAEAAAWARMVNQARASGVCEGMVVEASKRFNKSLSPPTAELTNVGEITHKIYQSFATQFLKETQDATVASRLKSMREIVDELSTSFKTGSLK